MNSSLFADGEKIIIRLWKISILSILDFEYPQQKNLILTYGVIWNHRSILLPRYNDSEPALRPCCPFTSDLHQRMVVSKYILRHLSTALMVIILGAIAANLRLVPTASNASPVYGAVFTYVAPAGIFFLLLGVRLKEMRKAGAPMLMAFAAGALGTMLGVWLALHVIDYQNVFGMHYKAIAGMMTGTDIGGSANFNAIALHYGVVQDGAVYTGMIVADNIISAVWMLVTLLLPVFMNRIRPHPATFPRSRVQGLSRKRST